MEREIATLSFPPKVFFSWMNPAYMYTCTLRACTLLFNLLIIIF